jgi:hypothetical protein
MTESIQWGGQAQGGATHSPKITDPYLLAPTISCNFPTHLVAFLSRYYSPDVIDFIELGGLSFVRRKGLMEAAGGGRGFTHVCTL